MRELAVLVTIAALVVAACYAAQPESPGHLKATAVYPTSDPNNTGNWVSNPTFSDEFNGTALDTTKWMPRHAYGWTGRSPSQYNSANAVVTGGNLQIIMGPPVNGVYPAGIVNSTTTAPYGYYEARIKAMNSTASSAFWFQTSTNAEEIDVVEMAAKLNNSGGQAWGPAQTIFMSVHGTSMPSGVAQTTQWTPAWDIAADYHVYGVDWNASTITWYVDGVQCRQVQNTSWTNPAPLMFDTEIFITWFGLPAAGDLPSTMYVDYVRTWTKGTGPVKQNPVLTPATGVSVSIGTTLTK